ncbi:MAG: FTR1 family iron permease [Candidatus Bathycorpusculaceae bacterium]
MTAIIVSYLVRSERRSLMRYVRYGISLASVASFSLGAVVQLIYGILSETSKLLFETATAFVAVAVLTSMIYWMAVKGRRIREETEKRVERATSRRAIIGLTSLGFAVVFREGFETVLFLTPFLLTDAIATLAGMFFWNLDCGFTRLRHFCSWHENQPTEVLLFHKHNVNSVCRRISRLRHA